MVEIFTKDYWLILANDLLDWFIKEVPLLLLIIIIFVLLLKAEWLAMDKFKEVMLKRAGSNSSDLKKTEIEKRINTLMGIIKRIGRLVIWIIFSMIILRQIGIDIAPILAGAGIIGLAIGFGAQELVRDFISGFFILLEDQVRRGDVASINGITGLVEKIELRTIIMRDFAGAVHVFQNGKINSISNLTKEWSAIVLDIGVAYKEDVDTVMRIMKEVGEDLQNDENFKDKLVEPVDVLGLNEFADSALVIKVRIRTVPLSQWLVGREYRRRLKYAFDKNRIEIPFPHRTIYWGEAVKPLDINFKDGAKKNEIS